MQADPSHTSETQAIIRRGVLFTPYSSGLVIAQYLSTLIMQRLRMEAVQERTSKETQTSQTIGPKFQRPKISYKRAMGITKMATQRSETAKDTNRQLQGRLSLRTKQTATHTRMLPMMVTIMTQLSTKPMMSALRGVQGEEGPGNQLVSEEGVTVTDRFS